MTNQLQTVFNKISKLKSAEQNAIAELLHQELTWEISLAKSQDQLGSLANEAIEEYKKGKTKPFRL